MIADLYKFVSNNGSVTTYTSADHNIEHEGEIYLAVPIGRTAVESKNDISRSGITISLDLQDVFARVLLNYDGTRRVSITVITLRGEESFVTWKGRIVTVQATKKQIDFVCESIFSSLQRVGLRQVYQRGCPHVLYRDGCRLNLTDFEYSGPISSVSGKTVVMPAASAEPNGFFTGGMFKGPDGFYRFIVNHVGSTLTLQRALPVPFSLVGGGKIYPGCDRTLETCNEKFDNSLNYGGFPWIPLKNPFKDTSIV